MMFDYAGAIMYTEIKYQNGGAFMKIAYETTAYSTGGRDGHVRVEGTPIDFEMALPAELGGGKKQGVNLSSGLLPLTLHLRQALSTYPCAQLTFPAGCAGHRGHRQGDSGNFN